MADQKSVIGLDTISYANGNVTTYNYNLANWLTNLSNKKGGEVRRHA